MPLNAQLNPQASAAPSGSRRVFGMGLALAACFFCISCSKPSRMQQLEATSLENQNDLKEMGLRVSALENRVESLSTDMRQISSRTYEVRNKAGRATGLTAHAVTPVQAPVARSVVVEPTNTPAPQAAAAPRTAPPRTLADAEKDKQQKTRGNSSPVLSLPPTDAVAPQQVQTPQVPATQQKSAPEKSPPATPQTKAVLKAAPALPLASSTAAAQTTAPSLPSQTTTSLALPPEGLSAPSPSAQATISPTAPPSGKKSSGLPAAAKGEEAAYKEALNLITSGRAEAGRAKFQEFLQAHPSGRYAANAHYWIGESYYSQRNYTEALMSFKQVSAQFPRHHKTADALLKAGMTYQKLGDKENAQLQFKALQSDFPNSEAAQRIRGRAGR